MNNKRAFLILICTYLATQTTKTTSYIYPQRYSINLIWIKQKLDTNQANLLTQAQVETLINWSKKNPTAQVNLWLDAKLTCKKAIQNLQETIKQANLKFKKTKIKLKNIRKLKPVIKYPEIFAAQIPIYFRVDLLKVIIAQESLLANHNLCFVYVDFDLKPITSKKLFDRKTRQILKKNYFVLAKSNNKCGFENGFQIFTYQINLLQALDLKITQVAIKQAQVFIESTPKSPELLNNHSWRAKRAEFQETVFRAYPEMISYFYELIMPTGQKPSIFYPEPEFYTKKMAMPGSTSQQFEFKNC